MGEVYRRLREEELTRALFAQAGGDPLLAAGGGGLGDPGRAFYR